MFGWLRNIIYDDAMRGSYSIRKSMGNMSSYMSEYQEIYNDAKQSGELDTKGYDLSTIDKARIGYWIHLRSNNRVQLKSNIKTAKLITGLAITGVSLCLVNLAVEHLMSALSIFDLIIMLLFSLAVASLSLQSIYLISCDHEKKLLSPQEFKVKAPIIVFRHLGDIMTVTYSSIYDGLHFLVFNSDKVFHWIRKKLAKVLNPFLWYGILLSLLSYRSGLNQEMKEIKQKRKEK